MTRNFPDDTIGRMQAYAADINFLITEVEQIKKMLAILPEAVLGTVGTGPVDITITGGGDQEKCFAIGKTNSSSSKSSTTPSSVTLWEYNGSSHTPEGTTLSAYNLFGAVGAGKFVGLAKDIDTGVWYIISAECGD